MQAACSRLLLHAGIAELRLCRTVDVAVPQQAAASTLLGFQRRFLGLELFNELRNVGLVGLPEERHGVVRIIDSKDSNGGQTFRPGHPVGLA